MHYRGHKMRFVIASKWATASLVLVLLSLISPFELGTLLLAQDKSQEKANSEDNAKGKQPTTRVKEGTKQAVEARLKAVEHAKPTDATEPIHEVEKTLFATRRFEQAVISPDGKRVAWVETLSGKDGAPSGNTAIYISGIEGKARPRRLRAGVGAGD